MLGRIDKIENFRVFKGFSWDPSLPDLKKYNIIFGWNGSGKTAISALLRQVEEKKLIQNCGNFSIQSDNGIIINKQNLLDSNLMIKVFNKDFINETVFTPTNQVSPIFFLGKGDITKQREVDDLIRQFSSGKDEKVKIIHDLDFQKNELDKLCIDNAKTIKDFLRSNQENLYNNYNKADFKKKCEFLKTIDFKEKILSDINLLEIKNILESKHLTPVSNLFINISSAELFAPLIEKTFNETVVSKSIPRLENDKELNIWVANGRKFLVEKNQKTCPFCEQNLSKEFIQRLEEHFNEEYLHFTSKIDSLIKTIKNFVESLECSLPNKYNFYPEFSDIYEESQVSLKSELSDFSNYFNAICKNLEEKKKNPFKKIVFLYDQPKNKITLSIEKINHLIDKNNQKTENFSEEIRIAREQIEDSFVSQKLDDYLRIINKIQSLNQKLNEIQNPLNQLEERIKTLENEIIEHRQPASELNDDLHQFLGRNEIIFEAKENGYSIIRDGVLADALSEGEQTAISFIYFLKTLKDKHFDLNTGIVVIDDPISSLDSNSLHNAFQFMKNRTDGCSQLIILTHNFSFFKEVKNWFNLIDKKSKQDHKKCNYYMLNNYYSGTQRVSRLEILDNLLKDFDSEYHYLFSLVYKNAKQPAEPLENYYLFPNISRRLLESFLAFRVPSQKSLWGQIQKVRFDEVKKVRIYRFVNDNSHANHIRIDPHRDLSFLAETQSVSIDLLDLIKNVDPDHYHEMISTLN